jgi:hypothetical protein
MNGRKAKRLRRERNPKAPVMVFHDPEHPGAPVRAMRSAYSAGTYPKIEAKFRATIAWMNDHLGQGLPACCKWVGVDINRGGMVELAAQEAFGKWSQGVDYFEASICVQHPEAGAFCRDHSNQHVQRTHDVREENTCDECGRYFSDGLWPQYLPLPMANGKWIIFVGAGVCDDCRAGPNQTVGTYLPDMGASNN